MKKYEGEFKNNEMEGIGIKYYTDGGKYQGEFKNNKLDGYGILFHQNDLCINHNYNRFSIP